MWMLQFLDGSVFRDGFPTQWEALRASVKKDGSAFKKAEALQIPSGTHVYRKDYKKVMAEGIGVRGQRCMKKVTVPMMVEMVLIQQ